MREATTQRHHREVLAIGVALIFAAGLLVAFDHAARLFQVGEHVLSVRVLRRIIDAVEVNPVFADSDSA